MTAHKPEGKDHLLARCIVDRAQGVCVLCILRNRRCGFAPVKRWYSKGKVYGNAVWPREEQYLEMVRSLVAATPDAPIPPPTWARNDALAPQKVVSPWFLHWDGELPPGVVYPCPQVVHDVYTEWAGRNSGVRGGSTDHLNTN